LIDQREHRDSPRHLLFLDADLGDTAALAGPLPEPVRAGTADMTIAVFGATVKLGGHGLGVGPSGARIPPAPRRPPPPPPARPAAERAALHDPRGVRRRPPARARLGRRNRADRRPAAPGPAGHRGPGRARAPRDRHRPARPAAPRAPARGRCPGPGRAAMTGP